MQVLPAWFAVRSVEGGVSFWHQCQRDGGRPFTALKRGTTRPAFASRSVRHQARRL